MRLLWGSLEEGLDVGLVGAAWRHRSRVTFVIHGKDALVEMLPKTPPGLLRNGDRRAKVRANLGDAQKHAARVRTGVEVEILAANVKVFTGRQCSRF